MKNQLELSFATAESLTGIWNSIPERDQREAVTLLSRLFVEVATATQQTKQTQEVQCEYKLLKD